MFKNLFLKVVYNLEKDDNYFQQKPNATKRMDTSSIQKCITTIKILTYGFAFDACDEYIQLVDTTAMEALKRFVKAIRKIYKITYLCKPTKEDLQHYILLNEKERDWPSIFGSLDCMHYEWKNCPTSWAGSIQTKIT